MKTKKLLLPSLLITITALYICSACKKDENILKIPAIEIGGITAKTNTSITCNIKILSSTGSSVTQCGLCWSPLPNPNIFSSTKTESTTSFSLSSTANNLIADTVYYIRAYAINEAGIGYSEQIKCKCHSVTLPSYIPASGLIGWWPFNGNANDESGNGNNGTVGGAVLVADRSGFASDAYGFNGSDNYIKVIKDCGNFNTSDFTISAWVLDNDAIGSGAIVSKRNSSSYGNFFTLSYCNHPGYEIDQTNIQDYSHNYIAGDYLGVWHHIVMVRAGTSVSLIMDGTIQQTFASPVIQSINNDAYLSIGARYYGNYLTEHFKGSIDDIAIWNRALTQQEITDLYNSSN
jgi:hypothetical protein